MTGNSQNLQLASWSRWCIFSSEPSSSAARADNLSIRTEKQQDNVSARKLSVLEGMASTVGVGVGGVLVCWGEWGAASVLLGPAVTWMTATSIHKDHLLSQGKC